MWLACTSRYSEAAEPKTSQILSPKDLIYLQKEVPTAVMTGEPVYNRITILSLRKLRIRFRREPIIRYRELCSRLKHPAGLTPTQTSPHPSGAQTAGVRRKCHPSSPNSPTGKRKPFADFNEGSPEGRRYSTDSDSKSGIHMKTHENCQMKLIGVPFLLG